MMYRTASVAAKISVLGILGNGCARPHARTARVCPAAVNKSTSAAAASGAGAERWTDAAGSAGRHGAQWPAAGAAEFFTLGQILH